jgi:hypothetical protein
MSLGGEDVRTGQSSLVHLMSESDHPLSPHRHARSWITHCARKIRDRYVVGRRWRTLGCLSYQKREYQNSVVCVVKGIFTESPSAARLHRSQQLALIG